MDDLWDAVMEQELQAWRSSVEAIPNDSETGGSLLFYRQVKSEPAPEPYILNSISINRRRTMTMLTCGCLPLEVETGRYRALKTPGIGRNRAPKTPLQQRICQLCENGVGDETHALS